MTIEEAVELVIQAGAIGTGGEVLVLDMGEPVEIVAVARRLNAQPSKLIGRGAGGRLAGCIPRRPDTVWLDSLAANGLTSLQETDLSWNEPIAP